MKIHQNIKFISNINSIIRMDAAGIGVNDISGLFKEHGIDVTPENVRNALKMAATLTKKSLPKIAVNKFIEQDFDKFEIEIT